MPILRYENLTHSELSSLDRSKTVVVIPSGPLEEHGPHLPFGVDAFIAEFFSERVAQELDRSRNDWNFILFPTIFAGSDTLVYTGSIEVSPQVLRSLIYSCCKQLARDGFKNIIAVGAHGGPRHLVVLEEVAAKMRWRYKARMISASSRILTDILGGSFIEKISSHMKANNEELSAQEIEALKTDFHGGLLETSLMMVAKPELVRPSYKSLEPAIVKKYWHITRKSGKKVGQGLGHLGTPSLARKEIGNAAAQVLINEIKPLLEKFLDGENVYSSFRSKFYYIPIFRTDFRLMMSLFFYVLVMGLCIIVANRLTFELLK